MSDKPASGMKILAVDDSPANIDVLCQTLENDGHEFFFATNGEEAVELAPKIRPDLILMDVMMPGISGFDAAKTIHELPATEDIPIIFLTAKHEREDILKGFESGGVDFVAKPFCHEEVSARVSSHLQLRRLRQSLEESNQELEALNATKDRLLGMAAHDLRNPLSAIRGFAKFMKEKGDALDADSRRDFLETVFRTSDDLVMLLNDLLDVSTIAQGRVELNLQGASLHALIEEKIKLYSILAREKQVKIRSSLSPFEEFYFCRNRIAQVLDNLLSNAVKYSPPGGEIFSSLDSLNGFARFTVRDQGEGIPKEERGKLFQPFGKLKNRPTGGETSSGLGLAIARSLIEAHGGRIWLESEEGSGAVFVFEIPLNKSGQKQADPPTSSADGSQEEVIQADE
ncbi:MAG: hybrid sensor histidine kinase/response regulator [Candidatus Nitrohelix vancouverensis]|uniref:histidine kinase n=1 Tax=Candidatus Nitrohelix vancouverensis TaxID=2705534 RepID=A0A7T0C4C2_9BACT|nr:MAG: hybrid sensor histidine kinase/response regulator [Candidatus Nitrohelix vancouverensis]